MEGGRHPAHLQPMANPAPPPHTHCVARLRACLPGTVTQTLRAAAQSRTPHTHLVLCFSRSSSSADLGCSGWSRVKSMRAPAMVCVCVSVCCTRAPAAVCVVCLIEYKLGAAGAAAEDPAARQQSSQSSSSSDLGSSSNGTPCPSCVEWRGLTVKEGQTVSTWGTAEACCRMCGGWRQQQQLWGARMPRRLQHAVRYSAGV